MPAGRVNVLESVTIPVVAANALLTCSVPISINGDERFEDNDNAHVTKNPAPGAVEGKAPVPVLRIVVVMFRLCDGFTVVDAKVVVDERFGPSAGPLMTTFEVAPVNVLFVSLFSTTVPPLSARIKSVYTPGCTPAGTAKSARFLGVVAPAASVTG